MSNFLCPDCGATIIDSPKGYETGCKHFPVEDREMEREYLEECEAMTDQFEETRNAQLHEHL